MVTVDRPVLGRREADIRNRYELSPRFARGRVVSATGARIGPRPDGTFDLVSSNKVHRIRLASTMDNSRGRTHRCVFDTLINIASTFTAQDAFEAVVSSNHRAEFVTFNTGNVRARATSVFASRNTEDDTTILENPPPTCRFCFTLLGVSSPCPEPLGTSKRRKTWTAPDLDNRVSHLILLRKQERA